MSSAGHLDSSGRRSVSLIIIHYNRTAHLGALADGLLAGHRLPDEVIVVDMESEDDLGGTLPRFGDLPVRRVDVARTDALPLAAARNAGGAAASGDALVFLDVDCIPGPDLVASYSRIPNDVLAVAPVRYLRKGWRRRVAPDDDRGLRAWSEHHPVRPRPRATVQDRRHRLFWSLSFAVTAPTWERLGGFDERYIGYGGEDTDLAMRAAECEMAMLWLRNGTAFHQWHSSADPPWSHLVAIVANANRFHDRWGWWPMHGWLLAFAQAGLVTWSSDTLRLRPPPSQGLALGPAR